MKKRVCLTILVVLAGSGGALAATGKPRPEKKQLTKRDGALAAAALVRRGDLGAGWRSAEAPDYDDESGVPGCDPDRSAFTIVGRAHAGFSSATGDYLGAEMKIFKSEADARGDFGAITSIDLVACIKAAARQAGPGAPTRLVSAKLLPAPRVGERALHLHMRVSVASGARRIPLDVDMLLFHKGRALGSLFVSHSRRPATPDALALTRLMASRTSR